uniref:Uncharacterized protein n=1 Tax=Salmonella enterica I TaxID=59201 RepID=F2Q910_SALET|nr:hypothetical protein [Salmonella enterica subsp. enterica] [Salmonella enterica subsp. enterica serovar Senftenberg]
MNCLFFRNLCPKHETCCGAISLHQVSRVLIASAMAFSVNSLPSPWSDAIAVLSASAMTICLGSIL